MLCSGMCGPASRLFLLPSHPLHVLLQSALRLRGIPFVLVRDKSVFERAEVRLGAGMGLGRVWAQLREGAHAFSVPRAHF